jgi:uncharacterized membrane protein
MVAFLILSIIFNTLFALCYKVAARRNCNLHAVNVWVYIGATITIAAYMLILHRLPFNEIALLLGIASGVIGFFATLSFFYHIKHGQLSASWTVISLSVAFPVLASVVIWHEHPSTKQVIAMVLIVAALVLFGRHETANGGQAE